MKHYFFDGRAVKYVIGPKKSVDAQMLADILGLGVNKQLHISASDWDYHLQDF